jgi:cell division protein ZapA
MKQLEVQIMGQSYLLAAPDGGEQSLLSAVEKVDSAMCKIRDAGKVKARDRIAVLAALNIAFESDAAPSAPAATSSSAAPLASGSLAPADVRLQSLIDKLDKALVTTEGQLL